MTYRQSRPSEEPREGSIDHERYLAERTAGWKDVHPDATDSIVDHRTKDVEAARRRLLAAVEDWAGTLTLGPWPGHSGSLVQLARKWSDYDDARSALRAAQIAAALPEDDDEPPF